MEKQQNSTAIIYTILALLLVGELILVISLNSLATASVDHNVNSNKIITYPNPEGYGIVGTNLIKNSCTIKFDNMPSEPIEKWLIGNRFDCDGIITLSFDKSERVLIMDNIITKSISFVNNSQLIFKNNEVKMNNITINNAYDKTIENWRFISFED